MTLFSSIEKPTLLLNEGVTRQNIQRMAQKALKHSVRFRPHFKTHQSAEIGAWFRKAGVTAITVSSIDMALYFSQNGWQDITIAFPVNVRQSADLAELARKIRLGVLVENSQAVETIAQTIDASVDVWLKIDAGAHRTGIPWEDPEAAARIARCVQQFHPLKLKGLLTHAGNTYGARGKEEVCRRYAESVAHMNLLRENLQTLGIAPLEVSVGDTPSASLCDDLGMVDEIRPGNFIFNDAQQLRVGSCTAGDVAVALACPVVALHPERREAVIYGGAIHLSKDYTDENGYPAFGYLCLPEDYGWSAPLEGAYVARLSQEHGVLHLKAEDLKRIQVGDLVCVLPAHSCLTVTLMKRFLTLDGRWIDTLNI